MRIVSLQKGFIKHFRIIVIWFKYSFEINLFFFSNKPFPMPSNMNPLKELSLTALLTKTNMKISLRSKFSDDSSIIILNDVFKIILSE